jgi:hypothetical protein
MRRLLIGMGLALSTLASAQTMGMGNFTTNPDKSVQVMEINTSRGALLQLTCNGTQLEVNFQPQFQLPSSTTVPVSYRFDDSVVVTERWNLGPFGGALYLPSNLTQRFLTLGADANTLSMSFVDGSRVTRQYRFGVSGFRQAIRSLACSAAYGFTPTMTGSNVTTSAASVIDRDLAYIAPAEFVRAFSNGSSFRPEGVFLAWEFNGVKLLLQKNNTAVQSVFDNRSITLSRPIVEVNGRTVVPASLVSAFDCKVVNRTQPTDAKVLIGCGAGQSYVENELMRY